MEGVIDVDQCYLELGSNNRERQEEYQKDVEDVMNEELLNSIRGRLDEGVLGKEEFVRKAKEEFRIKSLRSRGRPRKENRVDPI